MTARLHRLSNGVTVLCDPMPGLETLAISVVVRGGARWEPKNRSGWSHLLEHMVFKGAAGRSAQEIIETVESAGAQINAVTGYERTSFQIRALKDRLELGLQVLADLVLRPTVDGDDLTREKDVVAQEIAEAYDTPDDQVFEMAQAKAFDGQQLGRPILGTVKSIGTAEPATLDAWRRALYAPERLCVACAGAVDEDAVLALAERLFAGMAPDAGPAAPEPGRFIGGHATLARRIEQANLVWQLPGLGAGDPDRYASRLFVEILGGGMASRLFQEAREKRGLAYAIDAWATAYEDTGVIGVFAGASADKAEALSALVADEIRKLGEGVTDAELARAKAQLETGLFMAEESPLARAERAASQTFMFGAPLSAEAIRTAVEAVTPADLARIGKRMLAPKACATAVLGPRAGLKAGEAFGRALFA
ncbi:MAG: insulinase family protein [Proteobacteria bacterium]|nr:insulinase family protein [Pseudomonadota bacterium]